MQSNWILQEHKLELTLEPYDNEGNDSSDEDDEDGDGDEDEDGDNEENLFFD